MRHLAGPATLLALGLVVLASLLTMVVDGPATSDLPDHGETTGMPDATPTPSSTPSSDRHVLLVWGHGGTDGEFSQRVRKLPDVLAVSAVRVDRRDMIAARTSDGQPTTDLPPGWVYPLDTAAIDPNDHAAVLGEEAAVLDRLSPGTALLGATSARLRGLGAGATITLADGTERTIAGVVDDRLVGFAELVVHPDDDAAIDIERYLLVRFVGDADTAEQAIRSAAGEQLRITSMASTRYPRHGNGVLPQVVIKEHFGEFAMRDVAGRRVQVGATWRSEHLVSRTLPRVGFTVCHRVVADAFEAVLADLDAQGLLGVLEPGRYQGCWLGRVIGSSRTLSHHSWGLAVDVNVNPADVFTANLTDEVIATFERHGFVWGGRFLRPDEPHFEYVGDLLDW